MQPGQNVRIYVDMHYMLPFQEDSSLIFAANIAEKLKERGHSYSFVHVIDRRNGPDGISERQFQQNLNGANFDRIEEEFIPSYIDAKLFDGVIVSRVLAVMRNLLSTPSFKLSQGRPCFIAFLPGLDFTPEIGMSNRRNFDAVFVNRRSHIEIFRTNYQSDYWQHVGFGHPYFSKPTRPLSSGGRRNIYFFSQAISPLQAPARRSIIKLLNYIARAHPDRDVILKLRHLPSENTKHVHRERHSYPDLIEKHFPDLPPNIKLSACTIQEALKDAAAAVTCTSTAAVDAISAGVPTYIYLAYEDIDRDKYAPLMRREFENSGLIASAKQIRALSNLQPSPEWLSDMFLDGDIIEEIAAVTQRFQSRTARINHRPRTIQFGINTIDQ